LAVLALLLCVGVLPVAARERSGPAIRQETPFPAVFAPDNATERYEVLRGDFHMHTVHSDGSLTPADRVLEAWRYGYDVFAITDHGNFHAYDEALPVADSLGLILIRGMETGIKGKEHLVALGFSADYIPRNSHNWAETPGQEAAFYQEKLQQLAAGGGFVLYPHPHVGLRETMLWAIDEGLLGGIELKNDVVGAGWNTVESHGTNWYPFAFEWAIEHNLTLFANSDVHGARGETVQPVTLILAKDWSRDGVMEALRSGRTAAWFNGMLCAHKWVLDLLMPSLVDLQLTKVEDRTFLQFRNHGPVELTAQVTGMPLAPVTLVPYQSTLVAIRRTPDVVTIAWKNLYTSPTENLTTTHNLVPAPGTSN
jgi:hypothetical protein